MWNSWVDEVCSASDLWSDESHVLKAGKVRSWSFEMLLSDDEEEVGQVTGISAMECVDFVFKGSVKGIVNVDAIFVRMCLRWVECSSDVGVGGGCIDLEIVYGTALSKIFIRIILYCGFAI